MNKHTFLKIGRLFLSFLFVFGAISKLISMPFFDGMVAELFLGDNYFNNAKGMFWTQLVGRILVAVELVIGVALLQNKWFNSIVLPATIITLLLFTIHLFYASLNTPNGFTEGNCGCFGDVLPMTNLESIWKNIIGLAIGVWVWIKYTAENKFSSWVSPTMLGLVTMFTLSFGIKSYGKTEAFTPVNTIITDSILTQTKVEAENVILGSEQPQEELIISSKGKPADKSINEEPKQAVIPEIEPEIKTSAQAPPKPTTAELILQYAKNLKSQNLKNGKKIVCLFSMTCSHCQEVYKDICSMSGNDKLPNISLVNYGTEYEQNYFFSQAGNSKHPHSLITDYTDFKRMLEGHTYPRILVFNNGEIAKEWDVDSYTKEDFMQYFGIEKIEEKEESGGGLQLETGGSPW